MKSSSALGFACFFAYVAGCQKATEVPGYPLYPAPRLPRPQIARLFGPIGTVDGRNVADLGDGFELLPGCHVVSTRGDAIESTSEVSFPGRPRGRLFALPMQAGFTYVVKRRGLNEMGSRVHIVTFADELDASGGRVRTLEPAQSSDELSACRGETGP